MVSDLSFSVDDVDYTVKLVHRTSIIFRATVENEYVDGSWWDDDITYTTTEIVGRTRRPLRVYAELARCVREIIHSNKLEYCHFSVDDERRAAIYERFAKTVAGYRYERIGNLFYLFRHP